MKLYGYWRSSAAYRVRIALHLKGLAFESLPVHLVKDGGEQHKSAYIELNPTHLVPTLVDDDVVLHQSIAILEYLDEKYPDVALYPANIVDKAKVKEERTFWKAINVFIPILVILVFGIFYNFLRRRKYARK